MPPVRTQLAKGYVLAPRLPQEHDAAGPDLQAEKAGLPISIRKLDLVTKGLGRTLMGHQDGRYASVR